VSDLQPADECECRYFLTLIGDLGELVLKEVNVGFKAISWPHFDVEKVMATPLGFLASNILCEESFGERGDREWNHFYVVPLKLEGKVRHIIGSLRSRASSCLENGGCVRSDRIARSDVAVEGESRELFEAHSLRCPWKAKSRGSRWSESSVRGAWPP